jgi:protease I
MKRSSGLEISGGVSSMVNHINSRSVAFLMANEGVEQVELTAPWDAVKEAGGKPVLIAPQTGKVQAFNHLDKGDTFEVDATTATADPAQFEALVLPGGVANPDQLRLDGPAIEFVRRTFDLGKPAAVICHGPWTLVEADLVRGRTLTSWPSLRTDITNAGGSWVDERVVVCTNGPNSLVTSRKPSDLQAFCTALVDVLGAQVQRGVA